MGFTANAQKLNNNYTVIPISYLGKKKTVWSERFLCDGERLNASEIQTLGVINKVRNAFGSFARIPYSVFTENLGVSRPTICQALKRLRERNIIERRGQSDYYIMPEITDKSYLIIYDFLMTEELNCNGKAARIRGNAVLLLCTIISHYLNPKKAGQYFAGSLSCVAAHLNVATSTADYAIKKLASVGVIHIKTVTYENGIEVVADGKYGNGKLVYTVDDKILNRCREIRKAADKRRRSKAGESTTATKHAPAHRSLSRRRRRALEQKRKDDEVWQSTYEKILAEEGAGIDTMCDDVWNVSQDDPPNEPKADK